MFHEEPTHRVISLGGGVQSTAMTLMAAQGLLGPVPDLAVFADTGWEAPEVVSNVKWLASQVPFPVKIAQNTNLKEDLLAGVNPSGNKGYSSIPAFALYEDGKKGITHRQCTNQYKIKVIRKAVREFLGLGYKQRAYARGFRMEQWLGISLDEVERCRDSDEGWVRLRYPLIEKEMTRQDCKDWWAAHAPDGAPELVRSACLGCPYKSISEWEELAKWPDRFEETIMIEKTIQSHDPIPGRTLFLHQRYMPLREAVAVGLEDDDSDLFGEECAGYCGV